MIMPHVKWIVTIFMCFFAEDADDRDVGVDNDDDDGGIDDGDIIAMMMLILIMRINMMMGVTLIIIYI